jgi:EmrB/QacA subfamily drug resistance transporter
MCLGTMMAFLNISATLSAITEIQADLHASATTIVWITSAYSLLVASFVLSAGAVGDRLGHRQVFFAGALVFTLGSALAFWSDQAGVLILAQAIMGVGGAIVLPTALATVSHIFTEPHEKTRAIGIWASCSGLGLAIGPVAAGLLLEHYQWQAVYLLNVVLGVIVLVLTRPLVIPTGGAARRLDVPGLIFGTIVVAALTFAIIEGGESGYTSQLLIADYVVLAVALMAFVSVELQTDEPMMDIRLLRSSSLSTVLVAATTSMFGFTGVSVVNVLYLERVQKLSALATGACLLVMFVTYIVVSAIAPLVVKRLGFTVTLTAALVVAGAGALLLLRSRPVADFGSVWPGLLLFGLGSGLLIAPSTAAAVVSVGPQRAGMASATVNMFRQLGSALGPSVVGTVLTSTFATQLRTGLATAGVPAGVSHKVMETAANGTGGHPPAALAGTIQAVVAQAFTNAAHAGVLVIGIVYLAVAVPTVLFVRHRPAPASRS